MNFCIRAFLFLPQPPNDIHVVQGQRLGPPALEQHADPEWNNQVGLHEAERLPPRYVEYGKASPEVLRQSFKLGTRSEFWFHQSKMIVITSMSRIVGNKFLLMSAALFAVVFLLASACGIKTDIRVSVPPKFASSSFVLNAPATADRVTLKEKRIGS